MHHNPWHRIREKSSWKLSYTFGGLKLGKELKSLGQNLKSQNLHQNTHHLCCTNCVSMVCDLLKKNLTSKQFHQMGWRGLVPRTSSGHFYSTQKCHTQKFTSYSLLTSWIFCIFLQNKMCHKTKRLKSATQIQTAITEVLTSITKITFWKVHLWMIWETAQMLEYIRNKSKDTNSFLKNNSLSLPFCYLYCGIYT